jgi:phenylacetate-CoA ligase
VLAPAANHQLRFKVANDVEPSTSYSATFLAGGIHDRVDDMIHLRGNNIYPTAIEAVLRRFAEVSEFRIIVDQSGSLADLRIEIEPAGNGDRSALTDAVSRAVRDELLFRAEVIAVAAGTLPRFEMKASRIQRT